MAPDSKGIFERFSTTTVIRVFNFIRTSSFLVERLFWLAVLVGFSVGTIWNVTDSVQKFLSEPTASQVSLISNGTIGGIAFPNAMICFDLRADLLLKLYDEKATEIAAEITNASDVIKEIEEKIQFISDQRRRYAERLLMPLQNLNSSTDGAENVLLSLYHTFDDGSLEALGENKIALIGMTTVILLRLIDVEIDVPPAFQDRQTEGMKKVFYAYVQKGTNFSRLFNVITSAICVLHQFRIVATVTSMITGYRSYMPYFACNGSSASYFGFWYTNTEIACYRLPHQPSPLTFKSAFDYVTITLNPQIFYKNADLEGDLILIDLGGTMGTENQQAMQAKFDQKQTIECGIDIVNKLADLRRRPCSDASRVPVYYCASWCRVEWLTWDCKCTPLMRQFYLADVVELSASFPSCATRLREGKIPLTSNCEDALAKPYFGENVTLENCSQPCYQDCDTALFTSTIRSGDPTLDYLNVSTAIKMVSTKLFYLEIVEYVTMDGKAFVATLGGNLSLYLGASFLALIHIIVFFLRLPFERANRPRAKSNGAAAANSQL